MVKMQPVHVPRTLPVVLIKSAVRRSRAAVAPGTRGAGQGTAVVRPLHSGTCHLEAPENRQQDQCALCELHSFLLAFRR